MTLDPSGLRSELVGRQCYNIAAAGAAGAAECEALAKPDASAATPRHDLNVELLALRTGGGLVAEADGTISPLGDWDSTSAVAEPDWVSACAGRDCFRPGPCASRVR